MTNYLTQLYLECEERFTNKKYVLKVFNKKRFKEEFEVVESKDRFNIFGDSQNNINDYFIFEEKRIVEYILDFILYAWLIEHNNSVHKEYIWVLKPKNLKPELKNISFDDLLDFISPQSKKTRK